MNTKQTSENNVTRFSLCPACRDCPTVEVHHDLDQVIITDDFGGKVKLTKAEWKQAMALKVEV